MFKFLKSMLGPKFKVGDLIILKGTESWEVHLSIEILEIGKENYKILNSYKIGKEVKNYVSSLNFCHENIYEKSYNKDRQRSKLKVIKGGK